MNKETSDEYVQFTSLGDLTTPSRTQQTRRLKMEQLLTCPVCTKLYKDPRVLPCQHTFCLDCLKFSPIECVEKKSVLHCPTCKKVAQVPGEGVATLPEAFAINGFLELHRQTLNEKVNVKCEKHKRPLDVFCSSASCREFVCLACASRYHKKHNCMAVSECACGWAQQLEDGLQPIKQRVSVMAEALQKLVDCSEDCSLVGNIVEQQIRHHAQDLHEAIDYTESQLVQQVKTAVRRKKEVISLQKREAKFEIGQLQLSIQLAREAHKAYTHHQVVSSSRKLLGLLEKSRSRAESIKLAPAESAELFFEENLELLDSCSNLGELHCSHLQERYSYQLNPLESMSELSIRQSDGSPVPISAGLISCLFQSGTKTMPCTVKETDVGMYEIDHSPVVRGSFQLKVEVGGSDIPGSPFSVPNFPSHPECRGQLLHVLRELRGPSGVAVTKSGQVVVSEDGIHRVSIFSPDLDRLHSFGSQGASRDQFHYPKGLAVTADQRILVADCENHRIQVLTPDGKFLASVGGQKDVAVTLDMPVGLAVHPNGCIIVSDYSHHCVRVLSSDFAFLHSFGTFGSHSGEFYHPYGVAIDSRGAVYVADCANNRVQKFSVDGEFLCHFSDKGLIKGRLKKPVGIAIDTNDCVYVNEATSESIHVFSATGSFIRSFRARGSEGGPLQQPKGMEVDVHGNLFVCDHASHCLVVF